MITLLIGSLHRSIIVVIQYQYPKSMAPHAETGTARASDGHTVPVNEGEAPHEPGVKKTIAQGKMAAFPR